jgi:hypothetical protein
VSAWQPIETAPKDGTYIDVWAVPFSIRAGKLIPNGDGDRITKVYWAQPYYGDDRKWDDQWVHWEGPWREPIETETYSITHWMPIPEPPK